MKKIFLDDSDINILVKKSRWLFWIGLIILFALVTGLTIGFIDALMYDSERLFYPILMLAGLVVSFILFLVFVIKTNPGAVRKKYRDTYKIIEELHIKSVRSSVHRSKDSSDGSVSSGGYTLYFMTLSNDKEYSIEYSDYIAISEGRYKQARLETAEKTGKLIFCGIIKAGSKIDRPHR